MIRSLLKWPGGKSRVMPELLPHLPKAGCLVEPLLAALPCSSIPIIAAIFLRILTRSDPPLS